MSAAEEPVYRGRFAPSPTGPLHFGSLVAAVASYLDARSREGKWLVRMEDLDTPRIQPGAADHILRTLDRFGFTWDEPVLYQSARTEAYREAFEELRARGAVFPCGCTRKEIADSALRRGDPAGQRYPGTCRNGLPDGRAARSWRVRVCPGAVTFTDRLQGTQSQDLEQTVGDFVVLRADGIFAYQLAVVVDDAAQGITDIVRGVDLIDSTPRQIYLQRLLGLASPRYLHTPVAVNAEGQKLSKQTHAPVIDAHRPVEQLIAALCFLGQDPPAELAGASLGDLWKWAIASWQPGRIPAVEALPAPTRFSHTSGSNA